MTESNLFRLRKGLPISVSLSDYETRSDINEWSWVAPTSNNHRVIKEIVGGVDADRILDIGCGSGYWSLVLENAGYSVKGINNNSFDMDANHVDNFDELCESKSFYDLTDAELSRFDTWLLFWPPYDSELASDVLDAFNRLESSKTLIYIGEIYGCNATDDFCDEIIEMDGREIVIDNFNSIYDTMIVVRK